MHWLNYVDHIWSLFKLHLSLVCNLQLSQHSSICLILTSSFKLILWLSRKSIWWTAMVFQISGCPTHFKLFTATCQKTKSQKEVQALVARHWFFNCTAFLSDLRNNVIYLFSIHSFLPFFNIVLINLAVLINFFTYWSL